MSALAELALAWRLARRELRGGLRGFAVFLACLALGVAAIAAVGVTNAGIMASLERDARALLGGDIAINSANVPIERVEVEALVPEGSALSETLRTNAMARGPDGRRLPIVLRAVDEAYPLYGELRLDPPMSPEEALSDGGAVVEPALLARLGLEVGDPLVIGEAEVTIRAAIEREPDRIGGYLAVGPRVMVDQETLARTGVITLGSLAQFSYRVVLPGDVEPVAFAARLEAGNPEAHWRAHSYRNVEPQITRFTSRLATFLSLAGLTALLTGGIGVALATASHLAGKTTTIATFKCLGAPSRLVFRVYLLQILALAGLGVAIGLVAGQLIPLLTLLIPTGALPLELTFGIYSRPMLTAAGCGLLTALAFAIWPLARARDVAPAGLFRAIVVPPRRLPRPVYLAAIACCLIGLAALAVNGVPHRRLAAAFVVAAAVAAVLLAVLAQLLLLGVKAFAGRGPALVRMALANLHRPGSGAQGVIVALAAGLTVLTMVAVLQANLAREVTASLPQRLPSLFFIDIQPHQREAFAEAVAQIPEARLVQEAPVVRGRVVRIAGTPVAEVRLPPDIEWTVRRDRGLSYAAEMPGHTRLVAGVWWDPGHDGAPLVSVDANVAEGYGVGVGDTLAFNILGRVIEAEIASLREVDWGQARLDYVFLFSPGVIDDAPQMIVATVDVPAAIEPRLIETVGDALPNVTPISVREIMTSVGEIMDRIGVAVRIVGGLTLVSGILVLAGAVAAARRRQLYETVVLKVLGARRSDLLRVFLVQYAALGAAAAVAGAILGSLGAWAVMRFAIELPFQLTPLPIGQVAVLAVLVTLVAGAIGTWRLLGRPAGPVLRAT